MFLSVYRFPGDPVALQAGHARMLALIPASSLQVHLAVPGPRGLDVYDTCPSREVADAFGTSAMFAQLLEQAGLPWPTIERLGEASAAVLQGRTAS
jgi:hypothetical protein